MIFRTRYLQLAGADQLGSDQFARLSLALSEDPELWHAWRLLQQLYEIYDAEDEGEARKRIEDFVHAWSDAPVPEFRSMLKTLAQWLPEILAFHRCGRVTNGRLEGQNRRIYGDVDSQRKRENPGSRPEMTLAVTTVVASTAGADLLVDRLSGRVSRISGSDLIEGRLRPTPVRPPPI
ncbi:MAG: transposase [Actinobacteria bacterium]|nr:transposase [Actinomycetota bacterium]